MSPPYINNSSSDTSHMFESAANTDTQTSSASLSVFATPLRSSTNSTSSRMPAVSPIHGVNSDDPLQVGVDLAMKAVWLFLDSDFENIEGMLHNKRHTLMYASEGYAAIQYMRAIMSFTKEAMGEAQMVADSTINLAAHYRKPRGMGALLSGPASRSGSRPQSPKPGSEISSANGSGSSPGLNYLRMRKSSGGLRSDYESMGADEGGSGGKDAGQRGGESLGWFHRESPRLSLRGRKSKRSGTVVSEDLFSGSIASTGSSPGSALSEDKQPFNSALLGAKFSDLQLSNSIQTFASVPDDQEQEAERNMEEEQRLDKPPQRSWASGLTGVADSLIGIVKAGTQAVGISKPEWHALKSMTPTQRHAELVHAEAYLLRAMLSIASGDGILAVLKESWHVRSAYSIYRSCYAFIQYAHEIGETVDDHFVSGTYFGMGVFNLILSMMPAKLLRFIELVGFSADRKLGLELLAVAAGWRSDPALAGLMGPPPPLMDSGSIHPCGYGLRSEFCSLVLQGYHVFLCSSMFLGYPNMPLIEEVLRQATEKHPDGLIYMYFEGLLMMTRTQMGDAIGRFSSLVSLGKGATGKQQGPQQGSQQSPQLDSDGSGAGDALIAELASLGVNGTEPGSKLESIGSSTKGSKKAKGASDWRQLQYLGYWERSLCFMSLGQWMSAAEGFNKLRKENNWNKAVYTYSLASCLWEHYLIISSSKDNDVLSTRGERSEDQEQLVEIVRRLMLSVPALQRKVAGKSLPIEKYVIRKARKFLEQGGFLMRPGLELVASWHLFSKIPQERLEVLHGDIDRDIGQMTGFAPRAQGGCAPYMHGHFYDDLALLLLLKGCVTSELAKPSYVYGLAPPPKPKPECVDEGKDDGLALVAADSFLRVLRLLPLIERDHYLGATSRFHLGNIYLTAHPSGSTWVEWARAQWKCTLGGKPISSPPFLSLAEYRAHKNMVLQKREQLGGENKAKDGCLLAAPGCLVEERLVQESKHLSLRFYENSSSNSIAGGGCGLAEWGYCPPNWADSKKYSLQNALEVRVFNSENRLNEALIGI
ncbi:hypothetical protein LPJ66_002217 [Kickxella alabastrina]|uniref:Uncharacterized protein n=1 Tax=Kickxella alabastrina TaxID=61397 RepID=A0ACC1IR04_9FUNG|nr:hypothetical protein LPJ66_002217 [Kickxella alabastrina]